MKKFLLFFCIFIGSILAKEYALVSSGDVPVLSQHQVRSIYLKKLTMLGDTRLIPLNLPASSTIRKSFEKHVIKMSRNRLKAYWTKQHYLGHRPPLKQNSQEAIKAFVKKVPGAIGYVQADKVDDDLTVIYTWSQ